MPIYIEKISNITDEIYISTILLWENYHLLFQGVQQVVMENIVGLEHMIMDGLKSFIGEF